MTSEQRDKIIKMTREVYLSQGCLFPEDDDEMIEYLYDPQHPSEITCLRLALIAHQVYTGDELDDNEFFEWHGL